MRTPEALETLVEYGIVEEVLRPLMSGKEAQIFLVRSAGELRVAKIYKDAEQRSFRQRSDYTEGRTTRNTRDRRAMAKHSRHGKAQDEAAWRSAEVNAIYRLTEAGVRVPVPYHFIDGVLVMELVRDHEGQPAPRLGDLVYAPAVAQQIFDLLLAAVVRMLCAGVVHGDLSEFNVLMAADGPVVIDFPQAVDPASNLSARKLLIRDVDNLHTFLGRHFRGYRPLPYAQEMWELYQQNLLTPETRLRGRVSASQRPTNTSEVLALIGDAEREQRRRTGAGPQAPKQGAQRASQRGSGSQSPQSSQSSQAPRAPQSHQSSQSSPARQSPPSRQSPQSTQSSQSSQSRKSPQSPQSPGTPRQPDPVAPRGPKVEVVVKRGTGGRPSQEPRREEAVAPARQEPRVGVREPRGPVQEPRAEAQGTAAQDTSADEGASRRRRRRRSRGSAASDAPGA